MSEEAARPRARLRAAGTLAGMGVLLLAVAVLGDRAPVAGEGRDAAPADTPVLSARRVPSFLAASLGQERLVAALDPVLGGSPEQTCLVVATSGRTIVAHNPDLALVPASNTKLLTAHAALLELGPDHTFATAVVASSAPVDGVVDGDVWLVGGGDPVLTTDAYAAQFGDAAVPRTRLEDLADALVEGGVREITGRVLGDASRYDDLDRVPEWPSRDLARAEPGDLRALLVNRGHTAFPDGPDDEVTRVQVAPDGVRHAASTFDDLLEERGVTIRGSSGTGEAPAEQVSLGSATSPPLGDIVRWMLTDSDNTIAELLVKELGFARTGIGSTQAGLAVVEEQVRAAAGEAPGLVLRDGSGIHDEDRVSCGTLRAVLDANDPAGPLHAGLPVAGETGTLRGRFLDTLVAGRLHAKTGWVREATALSGTVTTLAGVRLTFSYLANADRVDEETVALQDQLGAALVRYPEGINVEELAPVGAPPADDAGDAGPTSTSTSEPSQP